MTCSRPTCSRNATKGHRGFCYQHHAQSQRQRASSGDWVFGLAPAHEVQSYIDALLKSGWSYRRIAEATGLSFHGLILIRKRVNVRADTAAKIYSLRADMAGTLAGEVGQVPAVGSMRRIQALSAIGYSLTSLAKELDMWRDWLSDLTTGKQVSVRVHNARRIAEVFDRLQLTPAPPSRSASYTRNRASARGWPPPFAWDEESIDNPAAVPEKPQGDKDAWLDDYQELRDLGLTHDQIAERWGILPESLRQRLRRLDALAG